MNNPETKLIYKLTQNQFAKIGFLMLAITVTLIVIYIFCLPTLTKNRNDDSIFFIILIFLGISTAIFTFGVMQSIAEYNDNSLLPGFKLGGPIVAVVLIVYLYNRYVPHGTFDLEVNFIDSHKQRIDEIKGELVFIDTKEIQSNIPDAKIDENSKAVFRLIPRYLFRENMQIKFKDDDYWITDSVFQMDNEPKYIILKRPDYVKKFSFFLYDRNTNMGIPQRTFILAGQTYKTDDNGFVDSIIIPENKVDLSYDIEVCGDDTILNNVCPNKSRLVKLKI